MPLVSVSNKVDGVAGWDKSVTDINNIDESFANARDLGYSRLNNTRVSVIGRLGEYDDRDLYKIQVQSNGKIFLNLRAGDSSDDSVLDLSKYELKLKEFEANMAALGIKQEDNKPNIIQTPLDKAKAEVAKMKEEREKANAGLLDDLAPGMTIKVYMQKGNKTVCIGDTTADKNSKEYANMKSILSGEYKAKKGRYYIEVSSEDGLLFITMDNCYLLTDSRYTVQAKEECKNFEVITLSKSYSDTILELLDDNVNNIGFEENIEYNRYKIFNDKFKNNKFLSKLFVNILFYRNIVCLKL